MDEVCRCCMNHCTSLENIFEEREPTDNETRLIVMLEYCTNSEIVESDSLPQNICGPCILAAKNAFEFKLRCEQSQQYFKDLLKECDKNGIKYEMDDICRFCNISCSTLENIFADREGTDNESLLIMLKNSTSCEISQSDSLPQNICAPCISSAKNAFEFKLECKQSQKYFKELLECEEKPVVDEFTTGDWCITESTNTQVCIKQEKNEPSDEEYFGKSEESSKTEETNANNGIECEQKPDINEVITGDWGITESTTTQVCIKQEKDDPIDEDYFKESEGSSESDEDDSEESEDSLVKDDIYERKPSRRSKPEFQCSLCPKVFSGKVLLNRHTKKVHVGPKLYTCTTCNKNLSSSHSLKGHMRHVHSDECPYKCELCPKAFKTKSNLKKHSATHSDECPYKCEHCSKAFKRQIALKKHSVVHLEDRPCKCELCPKSFKIDIYLKAHIQKMHSVELYYKCKKCPMAFKTHPELKSHKEFHLNERRFKCEHCPMAFKKNCNLTKHVLIHFDERPFKCENCPYAFRSKPELSRHLMTHSDERPFTCDLCAKTFKFHDTLKRHKLTHSKERPFICEICSKTFAVKSELNRHMKKTHASA